MRSISLDQNIYTLGLNVKNSLDQKDVIFMGACSFWDLGKGYRLATCPLDYYNRKNRL